jgi:hypothetical protein
MIIGYGKLLSMVAPIKSHIFHLFATLSCKVVMFFLDGSESNLQFACSDESSVFSVRN